MTRIIAIIGISCSGKTSLAKDLRNSLTKNGENTVIVSRKNLREMCYPREEGSIDFESFTPDQSYVIRGFQDVLIQHSLDRGDSVIVDNNNLHGEELEKLKRFGVPIEYVVVHTETSVCIGRNRKRVNRKEEKDIYKEANALSILLETYPLDGYFPNTKKDNP